MTRILVIDNYDSFVFTLVGYLQQLGAETTVIRNDEYDLDHVLKLAEDHDGVLISPGPGRPLKPASLLTPSAGRLRQRSPCWASAWAIRPLPRLLAAPLPTPPN